MRYLRSIHPGAAAAVTIVALLLAVMVPDGRTILLGTTLAFIGLAITLDLLVGTTGLLALGHASFFGGGAYLSTVLAQEAGWSLWLAGLAAVLAAAAFGLVVGLPTCHRSKGFYFAIITFAFGELLVQLVNHATDQTGGSEGLSVNWGLGEDLPFDWTLDRFFTVGLVLVVALTMVVAGVVRRSQFGLRLTAIRESDPLTRGLGFNPTSYKTAIFVLSSSLAALIGVLYAPMAGFLNPELMDVHQSIYLLGLLYVGGLRRISGAFIGVIVLFALPQYLEMGAGSRPLIVGAAMAATVLLAPDLGIAGGIPKTFRWAMAKVNGTEGNGTGGDPPTSAAPVAASSSPPGTPSPEPALDGQPVGGVDRG